MRWFGVFLRAFHLAAVLGIGISLYAPDFAYQHEVIVAAAITGAALLLIEFSSKPNMFKEWSGVSLAYKLGFIAGMIIYPIATEVLFWIVIIWSVIFAHAPRTLRHRLVKQKKGEH
jgi:membrane protein implicated in regulation of membrane protease activity